MDETTDWILYNYSHLLTAHEKAARRSLLAEKKIAESDSTQMRDQLRRGWVSSDPAVLRLLEHGEERFAQSVRERVFRERRDDLNFCPKCRALAKTPSARQCPKCFHSWHEEQ